MADGLSSQQMQINFAPRVGVTSKLWVILVPMREKEELMLGPAID